MYWCHVVLLLSCLSSLTAQGPFLSVFLKQSNNLGCVRNTTVQTDPNCLQSLQKKDFSFSLLHWIAPWNQFKLIELRLYTKNRWNLNLELWKTELTYVPVCLVAVISCSQNTRSLRLFLRDLTQVGMIFAFVFSFLGCWKSYERNERWLLYPLHCLSLISPFEIVLLLGICVYGSVILDSL